MSAAQSAFQRGVRDKAGDADSGQGSPGNTMRCGFYPKENGERNFHFPLNYSHKDKRVKQNEN